MASESEIYRTQLQADFDRQPRHREDLSNLDLKLRDINKMDPYSLSPKDFGEFEKLKPCPKICNGFKAVPEGMYCYHITNAWKLLNNTEKLEFRSLGDTGPDKAFERLSREYENVEPNWLPLGRFIGGSYTGRRRFTWWTNLELSAVELQCAAHRMGW